MRTPLRFLRLIWRYLSIQRYQEYIAETDHEAVREHVRLEGRVTSRYYFMVVMSCGIAMLGLLQSSPAVVIGAMLISPLMAPIMSLGFSLCMLNPRQMRRSLAGIVTGILLALAISILIVMLSPLNDPTPEILARTRPNLFDLLVALLSGLAGGYAVIKRKGETIVGVAIATALMPPLAVAGYGIAVGDFAIAKGAGFLFMTNLLAISLTVTMLAMWYGFGRENKVNAKHTIWQTLMVLAVFGALSLPLGLSLKSIAYEVYVTKVAKATISSYFAEHKQSKIDEDGRLNVFDVHFSPDGSIKVDAVMLTRHYIPSASAEIIQELRNKLDIKVGLSLDQIELAQQKKLGLDSASSTVPTNMLKSTLTTGSGTYDVREKEMLESIRHALLFEPRLVHVDAQARRVVVAPKKIDDVGLGALFAMEKTLQKRFPGWDIAVEPPVQPLPYLYFDMGADVLNAKQLTALEYVVWALKRWDVKTVSVVGFASTVGEFGRFNNNSLAARRAGHVVKLLEAASLSGEAQAEYRTFKQRDKERMMGINSFQRVELRLRHAADPSLKITPELEEIPEAPVAEILPSDAPKTETEEVKLTAAKQNEPLKNLAP